METQQRLYPSTLNPLIAAPSRPLPTRVAVIGAGTIGPDIGYYVKSALPDVTLFLVDVVDKALTNAEKRLSAYAQKAVDRRKMSPQAADAVLQNIVYTTDYHKIKDCELIIEAATENLSLKKRIFADLEAIVAADAIITSNTSSIPAQRLFAGMQRPQRTTVTHFFAPAWRSLPVEVIRWKGAADAIVDYLFWFFAKTGKAPIITDDAICFVLDRIFDNWCNESAGLLAEATASQIDKAAEAYVFAGPFFVLNLANGNPIIVETNTLQMEEGAHYRPAAILSSVDRWRTHRPGAPADVPAAIREVIRDRLLGILFSQSFDIVDRGIGTRADLNFGCQVALGFKKGPFDIMRDLGEAEVKRIVDRFAQERPGFPKPGRPLAEYQRFHRWILTDDVDGVRVITLRRPQAMNALNDEVSAEMLSVLEAGANDPDVVGFVVTGYGRNAFSAGADIGKFPEMLGDREASYAYAKACAAVQAFMDRMDKPVVAALNGLAMGGGLEIAIRCHDMVAMENAVLQFPEITLGILPGIGGCVVPYRRWPDGAALFHEMILAAKSIDAAAAHDIGMISRIVSDADALIPEAVAAVKRMRQNVKRISDAPVEIPDILLPEKPMAGKRALSREAVAIALETIQKAAAADTLAAALDIGYRGFADIACTDAAREGITAFTEKRPPVFNT